MDRAVVGLVRPPARLFYLKADPAVALSRMGSDRTSRPLLAVSDPVAKLSDLLRTREAAYLSADHVVDTDLLSLQEVIDAVCGVVRPGG
jgi:shikimate kinase